MIIIDIEGKAKIKGAQKELPTEPNSTVAIYAYNVLSTMDMNADKFLNASWEILKKEGFLHMIIAIAPYKNAFKDSPKRFFTSDLFFTDFIDKKKWKVLNFDTTVAKENEKDPNTWEATLSVKLQPIKEDDN